MSSPYFQLIAGTQEVCTTMVVIAGGQGVIPSLTPLQVELDSGLFFVWDGKSAGAAVYLTTNEVNAASEVNAQVYKSGTFNIDVLSWPKVKDESNNDIDLTTAQKLAAFAGHCVSAQPLA